MKSWQYFLGAIATSLAVTVGVSSRADAVTKITFDETPEYISDSTFKIGGVTFNYQLSPDYYGQYLIDDNGVSDGKSLLLTQTSSTLTLDFDESINDLSFDAFCYSEYSLGCNASSYTLQLFDDTSAPIEPLNPGGRLSYDGSSIKRAVFQFDPALVEEFVLDDIVFNKVGNPEPTAILGTLALGAVGLAKLKKLKR